MSHRIAQDTARAAATGALVIEDPGSAGIIPVDREGICQMESAAAEARTLPNPEGPGLRLCLRMSVDGGDITLTAENGLNVAGNTQAVFADVGDLLELISVDHTSGAYRWEILTNTGSVALS